VDGQPGLVLQPGDRVRVGRAPNTVSFIHLPDHDFLSLLHHKLHWKGSSFTPA
jgi:NAD+ kinase